MPIARANGIDLCYQLDGDPAGRPLLLIMGLGAQLHLWPEDLVADLVGRGFRVVRFDNRDVGESSRIDAPVVAPMEAIAKAFAGQPVPAAYTLEDMADDTVGLMDALGIARADVVGASLGGMIAQTLALRHPARVRSLVSIMSTTGDRTLPPPQPQALMALFGPIPAEPEAYMAAMVHIYRTIGSPAYPFDEAWVRAYAARAYARGFSPAGVMRQANALLASGSRRERLGAVTAPTAVIHGVADPLIPVEGGRDTAARIPGATLHEFPGMGHDLPQPLRAEFARIIADNAARA